MYDIIVDTFNFVLVDFVKISSGIMNAPQQDVNRIYGLWNDIDEIYYNSAGHVFTKQ